MNEIKQRPPRPLNLNDSQTMEEIPPFLLKLIEEASKICRSCGGTGWSLIQVCDACGGTGDLEAWAALRKKEGFLR
ncbi:MAG: hypothetical protein ACYTFQ_12290 [Planctomycetota bacterium]|jgi:hypothetical protein